jgi:hypothetical protein
VSDDDPLRVRASERLRAIASQAVSRDALRAAFATRCVAIGLALLCFAGGLDYFSHGEDVHRALKGIARAEGGGAVVDEVERVGGQVGAWKAAALAMVPDTVREYVVFAALLPGLAALAWGLRLKLGGDGDDERGRALWDIGRIILGPGVVGAVAHLVVTLQGFPMLRRTTSGFVDKLRQGSFSGGDVWALTVKYHGWTWNEIGAVLALGLALVAATLALAPISRGRVSLGVLRRTSFSGALYAIFYYGAVTTVAVASYGAALPVVTWPWKVRPGTFLLTLGLMALGTGIAWTGRALMQRARAAETPETK